MKSQSREKQKRLKDKTAAHHRLIAGVDRHGIGRARRKISARNCGQSAGTVNQDNGDRPRGLDAELQVKPFIGRIGVVETPMAWLTPASFGRFAEVVAIDASNGKHLWDTSVPGDPTGGATVVNDLVITGTLQGNLVAIDRTTGKIAWTHGVGYPISGWPSVAGDLLVVPTGMVASSGHLMAFRMPTG